MSEFSGATSNATPNVYFVDDSATMREVVKIAFRRESFNVVACADVASAIGQFEQARPDAVVSDVIMPDRDGYQLCEYVKRHAEIGATPVILLSGVVNREVADKAHEVGADELMRKPFHPQELVICVKKLLLKQAKPEADPAAERARTGSPSGPASNPLGVLFGTPVLMPPQTALAATPARTVANASAEAAKTSVDKPAVPSPLIQSAEITKLRAEIRRLESLVKKLQSQLETEREYCASLESQIRLLNVGE